MCTVIAKRPSFPRRSIQSAPRTYHPRDGAAKSLRIPRDREAHAVVFHVLDEARAEDLEVEVLHERVEDVVVLRVKDDPRRVAVAEADVDRRSKICVNMGEAFLWCESTDPRA